MVGKIFRRRLRHSLWGAAALWTGSALAHPSPDVPVHTSFHPGGEVTIAIELDPRCFEEDPETAPYVLAREFEATATADDRAALIRQARAFIPTVVGFEFQPGGMVTPEFEVAFVTKSDEVPGATEAVVFLAATATFPLPAGAASYRLHALDRGYLTVKFYNELNGKEVERFQALFPGETSYWLDLAQGTLLSAPDPAPPTARTGRTHPAVVFVGSLLILGLLGWWLLRGASRPRGGSTPPPETR